MSTSTRQQWATQSQSFSQAQANKSEGRSLVWFAATTLLGAFLVFQVQPIISKSVLPWFGGTPAVWTTCMLFFQLLLFFGYLYAHVLRTYCHPVAQAVVHLSLLCVAALALPIEPSDAWKPTGGESPTLYLLQMLARHVGLPYFVLSSTGPLVQAWLSYQDNSERVYRLYALSNAGSLFALLSYPFLFEPVLSVSAQSAFWSLLFCLFVLVQGYLAVSLLREQRQKTVSTQTPEVERPIVPPLSRVAWITLPALASVMLLVVTNHVCQDIAVVPFLWVLPLSLYLASFIVCFDSPQWYRPKLIATLTLLAFVLIQCKAVLPISIQLISEASCYMVLLFGACLLFHGEVARLKPDTNLLTQYYAMMSAGGAIGGLIVAVLCPMVLNNHIELPFFLGVTTAGAFLIYFASKSWVRPEYDWANAAKLKFGAIALMLAPLLMLGFASNEQTVASQRNFFGTLKIVKDAEGTSLVHGTTVHGKQLNAPRQNKPTTYYGYESGVGRVIKALQSNQPSLKLGVVGLGCGVLTAYGRTDDEFDLIEINPAVVSIANQHFTFMRDTPATIRTHLGDGRLVLERMNSSKFDLLVLDAFSSDAIPAHLLTQEAMELYRQRLAVGGVLAIHVSNTHLDLTPLVHRLGDESGFESCRFKSPGRKEDATATSTWMILAENGHSIFAAPDLAGASRASAEELRTAPLWTDQHHNLLSVLKLW